MAKNETKTEALAEGAPPAPMTDEEVRARRAALMEELLALPPDETKFEGQQPGQTLARGTPQETKVSWNWGHLRQRQEAGVWEFREVTFVPAFSQKIIWNGLVVDLAAGEEITTFGVFYGEYLQALRERSTNDRVFAPLAPSERLSMPGQVRVHRMGMGGLDPRSGGEGQAAS